MKKERQNNARAFRINKPHANVKKKQKQIIINIRKNGLKFPHCETAEDAHINAPQRRSDENEIPLTYIRIYVPTYTRNVYEKKNRMRIMMLCVAESLVSPLIGLARFEARARDVYVRLRANPSCTAS